VVAQPELAVVQVATVVQPPLVPTQLLTVEVVVRQEPLQAPQPHPQTVVQPQPQVPVTSL